MISDIPGHAEGHEALGAFNMDIELRNKLEAAARDAQKLATEAEQKTAALQSDHDSIKAALETERGNLTAKDAELANAQKAMADLQARCDALEAKLAAVPPPAAPSLLAPMPAPDAPKETANADDTQPVVQPPAA